MSRKAKFEAAKEAYFSLFRGEGLVDPVQVELRRAEMIAAYVDWKIHG